MVYLSDDFEQAAIHFMLKAGKVAEQALCLKAKCGAIIVKDGIIIGEGYNSPPLNNENNRKCLNQYKTNGKPNYDRTCCVHAEWRAILDALRKNPKEIIDSTLYFTRVNDTGNIVKSGEPFCTVCSRLALDTGIAEFVLWQEAGVASYKTDEYNNISYLYEHKF